MSGIKKNIKLMLVIKRLTPCPVFDTILCNIKRFNSLYNREYGMRKYNSHFLIIFMVFILFFAHADEKGTEIRAYELGNDIKIGKQFLLLIGINNYTAWHGLTHPVRDIKEIRDILCEKYYVDTLIELYDEQATKSQIVEVFKNLQKELTVHDSLFIMYSGHGYYDKASDMGFWIPANAGTDELEQTNWLSNNQIRGLIANIGSSHICLVSDSCFAGGILGITKGGTIPNPSDIPYFNKAYRLTSRQVLTSGAMEKVPDISEFALQLKMALRKNTQVFLDPLTLYDQIKRGVTETIPLIGSLKGTGHQEGACFLFFLKAPEPEYGAIEISCKATGKLYVNGMFYDDMNGGIITIEDLEPGEYPLKVVYSSGEVDEEIVLIEKGETRQVNFALVPLDEPDPDQTLQPGLVIPGGTEVQEPEQPKYFLAGLTASFNLPAGEILKIASPSAGCELTGEWMMVNSSPLFLFLSLHGGYIFHPKAGETNYLKHYHLLNSGLGIKAGYHLTPRINLGFLLSGGVTFSIIESSLDMKTVYLVNPSLAAWIDLQYNLGKTLVVIGNAGCLGVIGGENIDEWYYELSVGIGLGARF